MSYKSDFEDERRDREVAHSKMADMEKELLQLKSRTGLERATLERELGELEEDKCAIKEQLQNRDQELQEVKKELEKHKQILADLEVVHQKRMTETQREHQAKASQVKQYAKENESLKQQNGVIKKQVHVCYTFA